MLITMTEAETKAAQERLLFLHTSPYVLDNLTAHLMDTSAGGSALYESTARVKADRILGYLKVVLRLDVPERRK